MQALFLSGIGTPDRVDDKMLTLPTTREAT
jgi:hypothetical protein